MNKRFIFRSALISLSAALVIVTSFVALAEDQLSVITRKQPGQRMRNSSGLFDPESNADAFHIDAGETVVLAELDGPGEIQHIWFTIGAYERRYPRTLVFRIYWDGSSIPSVETPLGDFFAAGHGMRANVHTLPIEVTSYGRALNCYWKMPFHRKARLTMTNEGERAITSCYFYIDWVKLDELPPDSLYFHARYNQEWPVKPFTYYTLLEVEGDGQYVGSVINLHSAVGSWFGESDDHFYIDGEEEPGLVGTGFEDYFSDAWNLRLFSNLNAGITIREWNSEDARITGFKWHIQDLVMFKKSLKVEVERRSYVAIENPRTGEVERGDFKYRPDFCSSVAYWYQRTVATPWKPFPSVKERLMPEIWVELREMAELPPGKSPLRVSPGLTPVSMANRVGWRKLMFYLYNDKVGAWLEIPFEVKEEGRYSISVFPILFRDNGIWKVRLRGPGIERVLDPRLDLWDPYLAWKENYPENEHFGTLIEKKVGILDLKPGAYFFRFECVGSHPLSFDPKTGSNGYCLRLDSLSVRKLPWGDMSAWYRDYLVKEKALVEREIAEARKTVDELARAVRAFKDDHGQYPESLDVLVARPAAMNRSWASTAGKWPYFKGERIPLDPWGQKYRYLVPGRFNPDSFDVWSVHGNSRNPGGWIGNWKHPEKK
ncbi:MAG: DUF2961 domain-containing protein [Candidatus Aminicenantes bacterium]|nr:DUF2961 domain-containing protein [Candidatus Aminicenantes bacterium]